MTHPRRAAALALVGVLVGPGEAQEVRLTEDRARVTFLFNGSEVTIGRIQDQSHQLSGEFARTSRACPPFCITPMVVAPGVQTLGELEVLAFLETEEGPSARQQAAGIPQGGDPPRGGQRALHDA